MKHVFNFTPDQVEALENIKTTLKLNTMDEVVANALMVLDIYHRAVKSGNSMVVVAPNNRILEIVQYIKYPTEPYRVNVVNNPKKHPIN